MSIPGETTFGGLRGLNQSFYRSNSWSTVRDRVIVRDRGFDLGLVGYPIRDSVIVHHINPITPQHLFDNSTLPLSESNLISVSFDTHQRIHYSKNLPVKMVDRFPGDTDLW